MRELLTAGLARLERLEGGPVAHGVPPVPHFSFSASFPIRFSLLALGVLRLLPRVKKHRPRCRVNGAFGALGGTRTPDLLVRSQSLYPAELQAHF